MKPYISVFRMRIIAGLQYRAAAWAGVVTQFFFGAVYIMIYDAFYKSAIVQPSMPFSQLTSYLWLQQAFLAIVMLWYQDNELMNSIASGNIAYELVRPYNLYGLWFARLTAKRIASAGMRFLPILLIAFLLPEPYGMRLPPDVGAAIQFLLSMVLALLVSVSISMYIYLLTFITLSVQGSKLAVIVASDFLGGAILPIPLMPEGLQRALDFLPFRYTSDLPFRIYSGNIMGGEAMMGILVQAIWVVLLVGLGAVLLQRMLRHVVIQGG